LFAFYSPIITLGAALQSRLQAAKVVSEPTDLPAGLFPCESIGSWKILGLPGKTTEFSTGSESNPVDERINTKGGGNGDGS